MARGGVSVRIGLDYADNGAIRKASRDMAKLGKQSKATTFALKKGQLAWAAAGTAALKLVKDSIKAIQEEERSITQLSNALRTVSLTSANSQVEAFIANLEQVSAVADDQLRPAFATLVSQIKDVAAAEQVLTLATEISAATGKDLTTVTTALTKAYAGNRKALTTLGVGMDQTYLKTAPLDEVIGALNDKFSGSNQSVLNSYQGQIQRLSVAFGTMKEGIGKGLLDAFEMVFGSFDTGIQKVADFGTSIGDFFRGLGVIWNTVSSNPIIKWLTKGFGDVAFPPLLGDIVELGKNARLEKTKLHADDVRENKRVVATNSKNAIDAAKKVAKTVTTINKKVPAAGTAGLTAEDQLKMKFDIERIGLFAALKRNVDEETEKRLNALVKLNTASYDSELANITAVDVKTVALTGTTKAYTASVDAAATAWRNLGAAANTQFGSTTPWAQAAANFGKPVDQAPALSNTSPQFGSNTPWAQAAANFQMPTAQTTITVNQLPGEDFTETIQKAVNEAARNGASFSKLAVAL